MLFHHEHTATTLGVFLKDFPESPIICMTRDPRASIVSGVEHHRAFDPSKDHGHHLYEYTKRMLADAAVLESLGHPYVVVRVEDLRSESFIASLCLWLWHGDRLSKQEESVRGFSPQLLENGWQTVLPRSNRYVMNCLMNTRLRAYGYPHRAIRWWDMLAAAVLIPWPLCFERRFFGWTYVSERLSKRQFRTIGSNVFHCAKRVRLFYIYYWRELRGKPWTHPVMTVADSNVAAAIEAGGDA